MGRIKGYIVEIILLSAAVIVWGIIRFAGFLTKRKNRKNLTVLPCGSSSTEGSTEGNEDEKIYRAKYAS